MKVDKLKSEPTSLTPTTLLFDTNRCASPLVVVVFLVPSLSRGDELYKKKCMCISFLKFNSHKVDVENACIWFCPCLTFRTF